MLEITMIKWIIDQSMCCHQQNKMAWHCATCISTASKTKY